jgi:hypothetical protein
MSHYYYYEEKQNFSALINYIYNSERADFMKRLLGVILMMGTSVSMAAAAQAAYVYSSNTGYPSVTSYGNTNKVFLDQPTVVHTGYNFLGMATPAYSTIKSAPAPTAAYHASVVQKKPQATGPASTTGITINTNTNTNTKPVQATPSMDTLKTSYKPASTTTPAASYSAPIPKVAPDATPAPAVQMLK